ncbi:MAG: hypothetical protein ACC619_05260 [Paracoccaceae bacterium]
MDEPQVYKPVEQKSPDFGIFSRSTPGASVSASTLIAGIATMLWLVGITIYFVFIAGGDRNGALGVDDLRPVMAIIAIFIPIALIWVAASAARSSRIMKDESARLQIAINAMRHSVIQQQQSGVLGMKPAVEQKLDEIATAQRKTHATLAMFSSSRPVGEPFKSVNRAGAALASPAHIQTQAQTQAQAQASLELGTPAEALAPPLPVADFIRALHFPETAEDKEGFRALRRALQDRNVSQLIQAAQDVLTLISQDGIYMDDLTPDRARPEIWRRFAQGERGKTMAALGGIRDRSSLALVSGRMRQDPIFRDSVHHFLRNFDQSLTEFERNANDQEISQMTDTRTARAFMLLGRVAGTFD